MFSKFRNYFQVDDKERPLQQGCLIGRLVFFLSTAGALIFSDKWEEKGGGKRKETEKVGEKLSLSCLTHIMGQMIPIWQTNPPDHFCFQQTLPSSFLKLLSKSATILLLIS